MFTNMLLPLSLLFITCGITNGEEDSNQSLRGQNAFRLLEIPIQQREGKYFITLFYACIFRLAEFDYFKAPGREIRTPFRNSEIMTARGFGKRSNLGQDMEYGNDNEVDSEWQEFLT